MLNLLLNVQQYTKIPLKCWNGKNGGKLLRKIVNGDNFLKNGEILENVGENIKKFLLQ